METTYVVLGKIKKDRLDDLHTKMLDMPSMLSYHTSEMLPFTTLFNNDDFVLVILFLSGDKDFQFSQDFFNIWSKVLILYKYDVDEYKVTNGISTLFQRWGKTSNPSHISDDLRDILVTRLECSSHDITSLFTKIIDSEYLKSFCAGDLSDAPFIELLKVCDERQLTNLSMFCKLNKVFMTQCSNNVVLLYGKGFRYEETIRICKPEADLTVGYFKRCVISSKNASSHKAYYLTNIDSFIEAVDFSSNFTVDGLSDSILEYLSQLKLALNIDIKSLLHLLLKVHNLDDYKLFKDYYTRR